jgi:hypothetical protein
MYIISEAIFKGQSKAAKIGGYTSFSNILCDIFNCYNLTCDATSNTYLKKAYLIKSNKKPKNKFISLTKIILDIYNCKAGTSLCVDSNDFQWWIDGGQIRPKATIETLNFDKIVISLLDCCGLVSCGGGCSLANATVDLTDLAGNHIAYIFPNNTICPEATVVLNDLAGNLIGYILPTNTSGTTVEIFDLAGNTLGWGY